MTEQASSFEAELPIQQQNEVNSLQLSQSSKQSSQPVPRSQMSLRHIIVPQTQQGKFLTSPTQNDAMDDTQKDEQLSSQNETLQEQSFQKLLPNPYKLASEQEGITLHDDDDSYLGVERLLNTQPLGSDDMQKDTQKDTDEDDEVDSNLTDDCGAYASYTQGQRPAANDDGSVNSDSKNNDTWTCDVCKTATFDTYEEALQHEKSCRGSPTDLSATTKEICTNASSKEGEEVTSEKQPVSGNLLSWQVQAKHNAKQHQMMKEAYQVASLQYKSPSKTSPENDESQERYDHKEMLEDFRKKRARLSEDKSRDDTASPSENKESNTGTVSTATSGNQSSSGQVFGNQGGWELLVLKSKGEDGEELPHEVGYARVGDDTASQSNVPTEVNSLSYLIIEYGKTLNDNPKQVELGDLPDASFYHLRLKIQQEYKDIRSFKFRMGHIQLNHTQEQVRKLYEYHHAMRIGDNVDGTVEHPYTVYIVFVSD